MKFIKLEILNLASLDRRGGETIRFEEGALGDSTIFSIVGPTGSGKSTILDAICLALYNRAPRYPRKSRDRNQNIEIFGEPEEGEKNRLAPTDPRNILTRGKKEGYSKLTFLANNGTYYRAEWSVQKKIKNYAAAVTELFTITMRDGRPEENKAEWDELPRIIGLDYEQFLRTVLIAQGSFSSFIKAKEDERYELLEKLIGCEELYSSIAAKIKHEKDAAVKDFDQMAAAFSAQEKDVLPEEELAAAKLRMAELQAQEKQAKEELAKVMESIAWYHTEEKHVANLFRYEADFNEAKRQLETLHEQSARLALHDATSPAIDLYKDIKTAAKNIETDGETLKSLGQAIAMQEQTLKMEEEVNLEKLVQDSMQAAAEWERQKPHINRAREIKAELEGLKKALAEKTSARTDAEKAKVKADKDVADNRAAIGNAEAVLQQSLQSLEAIQKETRAEGMLMEKKMEEARMRFKNEKDKTEGFDAVKLQHAKTCAERAQTDLRSAIRIQETLESKRKQKEHDLLQSRQLAARNNEIAETLNLNEIEKLSEELDTLKKTYTLMTSEKWELHRAGLVEGDACPLCGGTHHPYCDAAIIAPVVDGMKRMIDEKSTTLQRQQTTRKELSSEQDENKGKLEMLEKTRKDLESEIADLDKEWKALHETHEDWPADAEGLRRLIPQIDRKAEETRKNLEEYDDLVRLVEQLRNEKETAENARQEYERVSSAKIQAAEKKVNEANTLLQTEKGKTDYLKVQQTEKAAALVMAADALDRTAREVSAKSEALKQEIGDRDPDAYEKVLSDAKTASENAVNEKKAEISRLREGLEGVKGEETATKAHQENERASFNQKKDELCAWLSSFNDGRPERITEDDIALLYSATDDWEGIRLHHKRLTESYTACKTTFDNEKKARETHQEKKPDRPKEELLALRAELESRSGTELIDVKARLQRHEEAKARMGDLFDRKREAESLKREWEEIMAAIGNDGKILRKIAQCYTLRFLVEHANVEIRKFNSRYELQQVKNSLGLRVIDHDRADDVRDTTSLSGGETFIVSLGLALGLSALSSRNISFGNLFIDEGFGTLDPDTLATVIDSLAMLQSSQGKKVGVISHTDTMSERITTQIRVVKNGNSGSSHIEIYP